MAFYIYFIYILYIQSVSRAVTEMLSTGVVYDPPANCYTVGRGRKEQLRHHISWGN